MLSPLLMLPPCRYDIVYGKDEQLLGALTMGCTGAVGRCAGVGMVARLPTATPHPGVAPR
jgi:hypothetical protein